MNLERKGVYQTEVSDIAICNYYDLKSEKQLINNVKFLTPGCRNVFVFLVMGLEYNGYFEIDSQQNLVSKWDQNIMVDLD